MRQSEVFQTNFLKKDDVGDGLILTIASVRMEDVGNDEDKETKAVMRFREFQKGLVLNKTNWETIEEVYGEDSDGWIGKRVKVYFDASVQFKGKRTGGLRIRMPSRPQAGPVAQQQPVAPASEPIPGLDDQDEPPQEEAPTGEDMPF
jgi:hypothetical protein